MNNKEISEKWWKEFEIIASSGNFDKIIENIKKILDPTKDKAFFKELEIDNAILDFIDENELRDETKIKYYELLEYMFNNCPQAINFWILRELIYRYIYLNDKAKLNNVIEYMINNPEEHPDLIYDITDALIVNNHIDEAKNIVWFYYPFFKKSNEIISGGEYEFALFAYYIILSEEYPDIDYNKVFKSMLKFNLNPKKESFGNYLKIIISKDIKMPDKKNFNKLDKYDSLPYFLRFLMNFCNMDFVKACYYEGCIREYFSETGLDQKTFDKQKTDEYLAEWFGILSLRRNRAFANLISLFLFNDFLCNYKYIDADENFERKSFLDELKADLFKAYREELWKYKFVEELIGPFPEDDYEDKLMEFKKKVVVEKTGRNKPCPCGSEKKYKKCCMDKIEEVLK